MKELNGETALITGGASGIGLSIGKRLAETGMKVVLADIEIPVLEEAVAELKELGFEAMGVYCDVSDMASVEEMKNQVEETFSNPKVVCLNAGVGFGSPLSEATISDWEWVVGVNLWGIINGLHTFLPAIREMNEGHIVITASIAGHVSVPNLGPYSATKFAAVSIAETLRQELLTENSGVGVSCLCPGFVSTNIWNSERNRPENLLNKSLDELTEEELLQREAFMEWISSNAKEPSEVAELVHQAILDDRFWIFTDGQHLEGIKSRHSSIVNGDELPWPSPPLIDI
ncbi:MAG: SDR family NAD(P)-dependent oxidoreductase [Acidimicrobiales bacterium]|nr:SDR family NAD(P)-dependent oxidoreductase [Acidimicrobiales bacterium]HJO40190.1 SDR family NAD(P)-dependent oxidoreductase [Acidimicrobiales bacterium]